MNAEQAWQRIRDVIRREHLASSAEGVYCAWLRRDYDSIKKLRPHTSSEQKLESFLKAWAKENVSASTQNQAFSAIIFFYTEVLGVQ